MLTLRNTYFMNVKFEACQEGIQGMGAEGKVIFFVHKGVVMSH